MFKPKSPRVYSLLGKFLTKQKSKVSNRLTPLYKKLTKSQTQLIKNSGELVTPESYVVWGYRLFLDREPENQAVVDEKVKEFTNSQELRKVFILSDEFRKNGHILHSAALLGDEPMMIIEDTCSEAELNLLFEHIQDAWTYLGETDPYYYVCISKDFEKTNIQKTEETFYNSGKHDVVRLFKTMERNGIDYTPFKSCLEYGCGVGRVTHWLAESFEVVHGYDISPAHLQIAEKYLNSKNIQNVVLHQIRKIREIERFPKVDLIYSVIVLQHNPPPIINFIIRQFIRALNPNGIALFQVPTYRLGYKFLLQEYSSSDATIRELEMHVLPQSKIFEVIRQEGGKLIEIIEDGCTGLRYKEMSNTFLVQKE